MIFLIFLVSSLYSILSGGVPITLSTDTAVSFAEESTPLVTNHRSTIQILWTCWAVVIASTWVCIHAHVPGYESKNWTRWGIRGRLFINALLFPDVFVSRAFREWIGAREVYSRMQEKRGQLRPIQPDTEEAAKQLGDDARLLSEEIEQLKVAGRLEKEVERLNAERGRLDAEWRKVTLAIDKQLKDKGAHKSDGSGEISGQSRKDWTIVHAHFIHMGGVAFKAPNGTVWFKDFRSWTDDDIKGFFDLELSAAELQDRSKADALAKTFVIVQCLWFVVQCIGRAAYGLPLIELEVTCLAYIACNVGMYAFWWEKPLNVVCPVVIPSITGVPEPSPSQTPQSRLSVWEWLFVIFQTMDSGDFGLLIFPSRGLDEDIEPLSSRFPVNYYHKIGGWGTFIGLMSQTAPLTIFGSLHALAWSTAFPSRTEQLLWRGSSVAPAVLALIRIVLQLPPKYMNGALALLLLGVGVVIFGIVVVACFAARVAFLVLPLLQLCDLPPLAHRTVPWSDFIPHV